MINYSLLLYRNHEEIVLVADNFEQHSLCCSHEKLQYLCLARYNYGFRPCRGDGLLWGVCEQLDKTFFARQGACLLFRNQPHRVRFILNRIEPCGSGFGTVNKRRDGQRTFCQVARIRPTTGHPHDRDESHNFNAPSTDTVIFHESSIGNAARSYLLPALSLHDFYITAKNS